MTLILSQSLLLIAFLTLVGWPLAALIFLRNDLKIRYELASVVAFAIIFGFGVSAFSASLSYSFLGLDRYFYVILVFTSIMWILLIFQRNNLYLPLIHKSFLWIMPSFILISLYFSKTQWDAEGRPILFSGAGPDVAQNMMAARYSSTLGDTWFEAFETTKNDLGVTSFNDATRNMFQHPSYSSLAVIDYLVFGVRWGLTIPFNQLLRIFGPGLIWSELGIILVFTFIVSLLISFSMFKILTKSNHMSFIFSLILVLNGSFLNQYLNGGISQAFGLVGNISILLVLTLVLSNVNIIETKLQRIGLFISATSGFLASSVSYIDGTFAPTLVILVLFIFYIFIDRVMMKNMFKFLILPGIFSLILTPLLSYIVFTSLEGRLSAVSGTGVSTGNWKFPTQLMGFFSRYAYLYSETHIFITMFSIVLTLLVVLLITSSLKAKSLIERNFALLGLATLIPILIGFLLGYFGRNKSDYLYEKIATYTSPYLVVSCLILIFFRYNNQKKRVFLNTVTLLTGIIVLSSTINVENDFSKDDYAIIKTPFEFSELSEDKELFEYLNNNNYIMPYKPAYSYTSLFGVNYWVSKAPNELTLNSRFNNPLKILCFKGDPICRPLGAEITDPRLMKYGIVEFESSLNTKAFSDLKVQDRYNYVFDSLQQPRAIIPEKFLGGNPYLK